MTAALARVRAELETARGRAHALAAPIDETAWARRPAPTEWSAAECLIHLSLTSRAFVAPLRDALARARVTTRSPRHRMDPIGMLLWWALTLGVPTRTTEPFVPDGPQPRSVVLAEFDARQDEIIKVVEDADGLDLAPQRVASPFDPRIRYNVYAALRVIAAHQRLHLRQAERALRSLGT
jgi:DinB superfamily